MGTEKAFKHKVELEMVASYKPNGTIWTMWVRLVLAIISILIMLQILTLEVHFLGH